MYIYMHIYINFTCMLCTCVYNMYIVYTVLSIFVHPVQILHRREDVVSESIEGESSVHYGRDLTSAGHR